MVLNMQALTIWPTASESPQLSLEVNSCSTSVEWRFRRGGVNLCSDSCHSICFRGFRNRARHVGRNCEFLQLCHRNTRSLRSKPRQRSGGAAFASTLASELPAVSKKLSQNEGGVELNSDCSNTYDGKKAIGRTKNGGKNEHGRCIDGSDREESDRSRTSPRIDVRKLAWSLHTAKTADDVEEVLKEKRMLPLQVYSTIIKAFGKENRLDSAMALFEWLKRKSKEDDCPIQPNLYIYNNLLVAMKQSENFTAVEEIVNHMAMEGVLPNAMTYDTLMSIYIKQGRETEALQLFVEMLAKSVSPSAVTYSTVLFAYRRLEDGFGALAFFLDIRNKSQKADKDWDFEFAKLESFTIRICYQVMRHWLMTGDNQSTKVLRLLKDMDEAGLQLGHAELESLVWACMQEEHCVVAEELYSRIRGMDAQVNLTVCNHVIWLMGKARKWQAALEIYEGLLDKGPKPNNRSRELVVSQFNILLTAAREGGIWRWGVRLLNKMEEKGLKPSSREWNSVLVACSKAAETSAAIEIFKRMVEQGEKPTQISYGALLSALEKGGFYDEALLVWKHMAKVGIKPNLYTYTTMVSIYASQGRFHASDSLILEMVAAGIEPTVVTFNAMISGCIRVNQLSVAYECFERMKRQNITPNEVTYETLIESLARNGEAMLAYELHLRANEEGLVLSTNAYDAVIRSAQCYDAAIDVVALGPRPPERKKKVEIRKNLTKFCKLAGVPRRSKPFDSEEVYKSQNE